MAKRWPVLLFVAAIVALLLWVVLTALHAGTEQADRIAGIASAVFGAAALVGQLGRGLAAPPDRGQGPASSAELEERAEGLARAVQAFWRAEEANRQIHDPVPLPVRWHAAPAALRDDWANIQRLPAGPAGEDEPAEPLSLDGQLEQIGEVYPRIPSRRLVVLGSAGAGKTVLAGRLAQQVLTARRVGDSVPVLVSLAAWNPTTTSLHTFLAEQLIRDHPGLSAETGEATSRAAALVADKRILPILDGFDELAPGLHEHALRQLNAATDLPLVITSRNAAYEAATQKAKPLTAAAAITLQGLTGKDLADYLPRTVAGDRTGTWDAVLERIQTQPETPEAARLHRVLTTPLMVYLARTIYSDTPRQNPTELLDPDRFPTEQSLQQHLLAQFVPAVYAPARPDPADDAGSRTRRSWSAKQARRYLTYLANHLNRAGTRDLAWWQLRDTIPRTRRTLILAATDALVVVIALSMTDLIHAETKVSVYRLENGLWTFLASGLTVAISAGLSRILTAKATVALGTALIITGLNIALMPGPNITLLTAMRQGLVYGAVSGVAVWVAGRRTAGPQPARARVQIHGRIRILAIRFGLGFGFGFGFGLAAGLPIESAPEGNVGSALLMFAGIGLLFGLASILVYGLEVPLNADEVASATESLARDRANSLRKLLGAILLVGCGTILAFGYTSFWFRLVYALLAGWLSVRVTSAWFFWGA